MGVAFSLHFCCTRQNTTENIGTAEYARNDKCRKVEVLQMYFGVAEISIWTLSFGSMWERNCPEVLKRWAFFERNQQGASVPHTHRLLRE